MVRKDSRVGHIAAEFERLANVLLGRSYGNPALITYPPDLDRRLVAGSGQGPGRLPRPDWTSRAVSTHLAQMGLIFSVRGINPQEDEAHFVGMDDPARVGNIAQAAEITKIRIRRRDVGFLCRVL